MTRARVAQTGSSSTATARRRGCTDTDGSGFGDSDINGRWQLGERFAVVTALIQSNHAVADFCGAQAYRPILERNEALMPVACTEKLNEEYRGPDDRARR